MKTGKKKINYTAKLKAELGKWHDTNNKMKLKDEVHQHGQTAQPMPSMEKMLNDDEIYAANIQRQSSPWFSYQSINHLLDKMLQKWKIKYISYNP